MPVTAELLSRLRSLDDLLELGAALGYPTRAEELNVEAQRRLGLSGDGLAVRRAAVLARRGPFAVYGLMMDQAPRARVAQALERLVHATPAERHLLFALDSGGRILAAAALGPAPHSGVLKPRQLRLPLDRPSRVALEILNGLSPREGDTALALAVRVADALAEEGLTTRFFREFTRLHARAAERLGRMRGATAAERRDLALVVLTRVLFLYFVQARGWLAGRSDFLPSLLDTALRRGHPFHTAVFEPLCFGVLNTPIGGRSRAARALGDVPFLNGGLFERHALERRFPRAHFPNEIWRELFDDLFERFHFTVRERDDSDAVDPEMLGRVFEGLMAEDRRRASGTYFTPSELLETVVRLAMDAALDGAGANAARALRVLDPAVGSGAFLLETLRQLESRVAARQPPERRAALRRALVRDCLFGVDLDPMAVRLAELRLWLALVVEDDARWDEVAPLPNLDHNLRQGDSLLSPLDFAPAPAGTRAARVAEQRRAYFAASGRDKAALARAIRVEERALATEALDASIAALTARLKDAASAAGRDLFGRRTRRPVAASRRVIEWRSRRRELQQARRRLAAEGHLPFFSYEVHFGHAAQRGGFDVVVGNPPWVRGERLPPETRRLLERRYPSFRATAGSGRAFAHLPDLSVAFVERALELVRPGGVVALVLPAKLLRAGYAGALRLALRRTATVLALEDLAHASGSGFAATVFPMVCVLRRAVAEPGEQLGVRLVGSSGRVLEGRASQKDLSLDAASSTAPWLAMPADVVRALRTVLRSGPRLGSRFVPRLGVKTGANAVFVRPLARAGELPGALRAPAVLGRDVSPFRARESCVLLAALDRSGAPLPSVPGEVASYLAPYAGMLSRRADAKHARPWALFRTELLRARWLVIWRDIAPRLEAASLERAEPGSAVPLNTCYGVAVPDQDTAFWLAALLNSGPARAVAAALAERASGGCFRFHASTVGSLPLPPHPENHDVLALAAIGREAARGEGWNQDELDHHAARALGLGADDLALLGHLADTLCRNPARDR